MTLAAHGTKPGLYEFVMRVDVNNCQYTAAVVAWKESAELWHKRLGNFSDDVLKKFLEIMKGIHIQVEAKASKDCQSCILGKCKRHPRPQIKNN